MVAGKGTPVLQRVRVHRVGKLKMKRLSSQWPLTKRQRQCQRTCHQHRSGRDHHREGYEFTITCLVFASTKPDVEQEPHQDSALQKVHPLHSGNEYIPGERPAGKLVQKEKDTRVK